MKKSFFGLFLAIMMMLVVLPGMVQTAQAETAVFSVTTTNGDTKTYEYLEQMPDAVSGLTAADQAVVKLLKDLSGSYATKTITSGVFTLDLNGKTVHCSSTREFFLINGSGVDMVIRDSVGGGALTTQKTAVKVNAGKVTIEDATISGNDFASIHLPSGSSGNVIINSGTFSRMQMYGGTMTINDGTFTMSPESVWIYKGTLNVKGGTFRRIASEGGTTNIFGGAIETVRMGAGTCNIYGGTFSSSENHIAWTRGTVKLYVGSNGVGATFKGGIDADRALNGMLTDGAAYWQGNKMILPADDAKSITGGDVVIKAACTHPNANKVVTASTCTEQGYTTYTCSDCDNTWKDDYTEANGHTYSTEWSYDGETHWHAATCGHDLKADEAAHTGGAATCKEKAQCFVCSQFYGSFAEHSYEYALHSDQSNVLVERCVYGCSHEAEATLFVGQSVFAYNGEFIEPAEMDYSETWKGARPDYGITYSNHINAGIATASFELQGYTLETTFEIINADFKVTITADNLEYSGEAQTPVVTIKTDGIVNNHPVTFAYSTEVNGTYSSSLPSVTAHGEHTIYYKATAPNHNDVAGSFTVTVNGPVHILTYLDGTGNGTVFPDRQYEVEFGMPITGDLAPQSDPERTGYTFTGWSPEAPAVMPNEDLTITAQWKINQYTITFDSNGGSAVEPVTQDYGTSVTAPADPTREGYIFAGWDKVIPSTMPAENVTITAKWTAIPYKLTYQVGNTVVYQAEYETGTPLPAPSGITLENIPENYYGVSLPDDAPSTMPTEDTVIECQWTVYLALLKEDGETLQSFKQVTLGEDVYANYTGNYYKADHEFWLVNVADDTERYTLRYESGMPVWPTIPMDQNKTFRATFIPIPKTFEVTLHNLFSDLCTVVIDKNTATEGEELVVTLTPPENSRFHITSVQVEDTTIQGYTFENNVLTIPGEMITGNVTISGIAYVSLTMEANGGKVIAEEDNDYELTETSVTIPVVAYGATSTITSDVLATYFARTGYTAIGLNTKSDGSGTSYGLGESFTMTEDTVLYVMWKNTTSTYTVTIDPNITNGTVEADKTTATQGETVILTAEADKDYHLAGLSVTDASGNSCQTFEVRDQDTDDFLGYGFTMPASDATVTAVFSSDEDEGYAVIVTPTTDGTVKVNKTTAPEGETIIFTAEPDAGCELGTISVTNEAGNELLVMENTDPGTGKSDYRFTMPAGNVTITVLFARRYAIAYGNGVTGPATAKAGETVTLTATANDGYQLAEISVTDVSGNICPIIEVVDPVTSEVSYEFEMPESNVTVYVTFRELVPDVPTEYSLNLQLQAVDNQDNVISEWVYGYIDDSSCLDNISPTAGLWTVGEHYVVFEDGLVPEGYLTPDAFTFTVNADGTVSSNAADVELKGDVWVLTIVLEKDDEQVPVPTYTVTWVDEDGSVLETDENVPNGATPSYDGQTPTKAADSQYRYVFAGWEPEVAVVSADVTYTAVYTSSVNHYTVTWVDENENVVATEVVEYGNNAQNAPDVPVKVGYSGEWDHDGAYITEDTTIHPRYTINQYTISFDSDGGSAIESITADYGTIISKPDDPTKEGYVFVGWDTEIPETMPAADMTITAKWELMSIVIETYIMNTEGHYPETPNKTQTLGGNSLIPTPMISLGFDLDTENSITTGVIINGKRVYRFYIKRNQYTLTTVVDGVETHKAYYFEASVTAPAEPTKPGYTFAGWVAKDENGIETAYTIPATMPAQEVTVYAKWEAAEDVIYTVKHHYQNIAGDAYIENVDEAEEKKGTTGTLTEAVANVTEGFAAQTIVQQTIAADGSTVVDVYYDRNEYIIEFVNGATVMQSGKWKYGSTPSYTGETPTKAEDALYTYAFEGWAPEVVDVTGEATYTAIFASTPKAYTVTFVDHDGTELKKETVEAGKNATAPTDPTREGYTFTGWDKDFTNVQSDLTVTAQYELIPVVTYTVTFVDHDGTELKKETVEAGKDATAPAAPAREGYTFTGWDKDFTNVQSDLTVTAQYELIPVVTYMVTFVDHDGTELKKETVEAGKDATAPAAPTRDGYTFTGWDKDFTNVQSDLTVTAQYELIPVVTYHLTVNNGTGSGEYAEGTSVAITANAPVDGYRFKAWSGVEGLIFLAGGPNFANSVIEMPAHAVEIAAVYELIPVTTYTVSFNANGGTGSMTAVQGVSGSYQLPECSFTAPAGMQFDCWQVNGVEYAPGAQINVTADVNAYAVWEVIPPIGADPVIVSPTTEQTITVHEGEQATMSIVAENAASYQWYVNYNDGTGWNQRGENSPTYVSTPTKLSNDGYRYKCVVTGTNGKTVESYIFTLEVLEKIELPETGDNSQIGLWMTMCFISFAGILVFSLGGKKRKTE